MDNDGGDPAENQNSWWKPSKCKGCEHNVRPSPYVCLLAWIDRILTGCGGIEIEALPLTTWEDLGLYRQVTAPRMM